MFLPPSVQTGIRNLQQVKGNRCYVIHRMDSQLVEHARFPMCYIHTHMQAQVFLGGTSFSEENHDSKLDAIEQVQAKVEADTPPTITATTPTTKFDGGWEWEGLHRTK